MCLPSAYCATSSGIDIIRLRERTQPISFFCVRTSVQSSITTGRVFFSGAGGGGAVIRGTSPSTRSVDSSCQLAGGFGGLGLGGSRKLCREDDSLRDRRGGAAGFSENNKE